MWLMVFELMTDLTALEFIIDLNYKPDIILNGNKFYKRCFPYLHVSLWKSQIQKVIQKMNTYSRSFTVFE